MSQPMRQDCVQSVKLEYAVFQVAGGMNFMQLWYAAFQIK